MCKILFLQTKDQAYYLLHSHIVQPHDGRVGHTEEQSFESRAGEEVLRTEHLLYTLLIEHCHHHILHDWTCVCVCMCVRVHIPETVVLLHKSACICNFKFFTFVSFRCQYILSMQSLVQNVHHLSSQIEEQQRQRAPSHAAAP